ncbi:MAG: DUF2256 domain-containing protein [Chlorobi bacterium]|nr:DUF2256 domain-containing protein [Chlorobiota bacterium]
MSISKKCVVCGKEFTAKNDKGMYCSPSCRVKAHRKREKGEQSELAKNITEEYFEELSFFRMQLNDIYEDVHKLQSEMVSVTKYLYAFAEKVIGIPDFQDMIVLKNDISDLSDKLNDEISDLKEKHEEKIIKNDENIKMLGFKINQIVHIINDSPLNHKKIRY